MPLLLLRHPMPDVSFGLWLISEPEIFFKERMPLHPEEAADLARLQGSRRLEWLGARWLLHNLTGRNERLPLAKTAFAKPFFVEWPGWFCSLSHSKGLVGALLAPTDCGCDIQMQVEKMGRLSPKFINAGEQEEISRFPASYLPDLQHLMWTCKESLYKAYGLKLLDFRTNLFVRSIEWDGATGRASGQIIKKEVHLSYSLHFERFELPDEAVVFWTVCLPDHSASK